MDYKIYDYLHDDAKDIRINVFMKEQGFENEFDDIDLISKHVVIYDNKPIGTCRYFKEDGKYYIGRVCVNKEYRGKKIGDLLLKVAEDDLKKDTSIVYLSAQERISSFYERNGYKKEGTPYDDEGVPHILMSKEL